MRRREGKRVSFHVQAAVDFSGKNLLCEVGNISTRGMFILSSERIPLNSVLDISILLSGDTSVSEVNLHGIVIRKESEGIAVLFTRTDLETFVFLKNIVAFNEDSSVQDQQSHFDDITV